VVIVPPPPWEAVPEGTGAWLESELRREIGHPDHPLHGAAYRAVARCGGCDDVVFALPGGRYAVVHLTGRGTPEHDPRWPTTRWFGSWTELRAAISAHEH
jgi:hypothetical protein